jgi:hypothetical protein
MIPECRADETGRTFPLFATFRHKGGERIDGILVGG